MSKIYVLDSCVTNNFKDKLLLEKITNAWGSVANAKSPTSIKYGVYHNYENDYKGDYTLSIATGDETDSSNVLEIPSDVAYKIFLVDTSKNVENPVFETWKQIWELEEKLMLKRDYVLDYEKYYPDGTIEIYIGEKNSIELKPLS